MQRIACLAVQKNAEHRLRPWLTYHGYLFGFENIFLFDLHSDEPSVISILDEFKALGVTVERVDAPEQDAPSRDVFIKRSLSRLQSVAQCSRAVHLACDEFLAISGARGIECNRQEILDRLSAPLGARKTFSIDYSLDNWPGYADLFEYHRHHGQPRGAPDFGDFRETSLGADPEAPPAAPPGELIKIRYPNKPLKFMRDAADIEAADQPRRDKNPPGPLVRFRGLSRLIAALSPSSETLAAWASDSGSNAVDPAAVPIIDLDVEPFAANEYLRANPDLQGANIEPFFHFVSSGYQEGRRTDNSVNAVERSIERLARLRAMNRPDLAGYLGVTLQLARVSRVEEADAILLEGLRKFGEPAPLLKEFALSATYQGKRAEAVMRWERLRSCFPDMLDGYLYGAKALRDAGDYEQADLVAAAGLSRFPAHIRLRVEQAEIASERLDTARAKTLWTALIEGYPDNVEVRQRALERLYEVQLAQDEADSSAAEIALERPVLVGMSEAEISEALDFLRLTDVKAMRDLFMGFDSLGHNCEVGLVQRRYGAEPISLLRWSFISFDNLLKGLAEGFSGLENPENLTLSLGGGREYVLRDQEYRTLMHTFAYEGSVDPNRLKAQLLKRTSYLQKKIIADLSAAEKIFVHVDAHNRPPSEVRQLHKLMRSYGNTQLLHVQVADKPSKIGVLEDHGDGLFFGYIRKLGPNGDKTWTIDFDGWLRIARSLFMKEKEGGLAA